MSGPATTGRPLASAQCQQGVVRLPVVGRFLGFDEVPRQRQVDGVEGFLQQRGRFRRGGDEAEAAAERRFKTRLPLPANLEHLIDVGVDKAVGDMVGEVQSGLCFPVDVVRRRPARWRGRRRWRYRGFPA